MENTKRCSSCKIIKPLDEFHKRKNGENGYDHECKKCGNFRHRVLYANKNKFDLNDSDVQYSQFILDSKNEYIINKSNKLNKRCSICHQIKLKSEFHKNKSHKDGYHHVCKICDSDRKKKLYAESSEYRNKQRLGYLKSVYKIDENIYKNMLIQQNNKCAICKNEFKSSRTTHIDHNHNTGKVRELLCSKCNHLLGLSDENIDRLKSAITYLERHS